MNQLFLGNENIDFDKLYPHLKGADAETLLAVTKRVISTGQFLPQWFLERYMEVDSGGCVRSLTSGGRCVEAARVSVRAVRAAAAALQPRGPPAAAPLAPAAAALRELAPLAQRPYVRQVYEELDNTLKEYMQIVKRTSEDMKLAMVQ
ncbi:hypothetical protein ACJJTC_014922 [Scirpophaga incertulas]